MLSWRTLNVQLYHFYLYILHYLYLLIPFSSFLIYIMDTSIVYVITQLKGKINWESVLNKRNLRKNIQKTLHLGVKH